MSALTIDLADLPALIASPPRGPLALCVLTATADEALEVVRLLRAHRRPIARCCVGIALVADGAARDVAVEWAGRVTVPFTALPTEAAAHAWLDGQLTVGLRGVRPRGGSRGIGLPPWVQDYVEAQFNPPADAVAARLVADTRARFPSGAGMCIGESQGRLMRLLVELSGARDIVEVGTFTGSSALWMARGLPADGRLTCFEIDPRPIELARAAWKAAGVDDRIAVTLGPAAESLARLPAEPCIDVGFVDADKQGYETYLELILARLRPAGFILFDNTLWGGSVVDDRVQDASTQALRRFNARIAKDPTLRVQQISIGDGLTVVRRRASTRG